MKSKNNHKKILTFFLAMLMLVTSLPFQVFANNNESISRSMGANPEKRLLTPASGVMHASKSEGTRKATFTGKVSDYLPANRYSDIYIGKEKKLGPITIEQKVFSANEGDAWFFTIEYTNSNEMDSQCGKYSADLFFRFSDEYI